MKRPGRKRQYSSTYVAMSGVSQSCIHRNQRPIPYRPFSIEVLEILANLSLAGIPRHMLKARPTAGISIDLNPGVHTHAAYKVHSLGAKRFTPASTAAAMRFFCVMLLGSVCVTTKESSV